VVIGFIGRYGAGSRSYLPDWVDVLVVIVFSLTIFYWAVSISLTKEQTEAAVAKDAKQLDAT